MSASDILLQKRNRVTEQSVAAVIPSDNPPTEDNVPAPQKQRITKLWGNIAWSISV
jgi:hypothetical protein